MGRSCFICNSPNLAEYNKMRLEGIPIKEIFAYSQNKYNEKHLRYHHFQKHFSTHVEELVETQVKASRIRDEYVKTVIKKDMEIVKRMSRNLEIVADKIEEKAANMDNPVAEEMFLKFATEGRMIIEQYLKWGSKVQLQDTTQDVFNRVIECMIDFPSELISKFIERWKEIGGSST